MEALEKSAENCIPEFHLPSGRKKQNMPGWLGWNTEVKPFRENAAFWFSVWKSAGRPLNTELHKIMKRTRNLYHFQFKKCQKSEDLIKKNNFLNASLNGSSDIFTEIKKLRKSNRMVANSMDGKTENIQEHFAGIYSNLYNSVDDRSAVDDLYKEVEGRIDSKSQQITEKNSPDISFSHLSVIIQSFLTTCSCKLCASIGYSCTNNQK